MLIEIEMAVKIDAESVTRFAKGIDVPVMSIEFELHRGCNRALVPKQIASFVVGFS